MSARIVRRIILPLAVLACAVAEAAGPEPAARRGRLPHVPPIVDMHMHIGPTEIDRLHSIMDEVGIGWGMNLSGMWPGGPLERQLAAAKRSGRLVVAMNLPWFAARERPADFPELCADLLDQGRRLGARALKVEKGLGLHVTKADGSRLAVDDPWLDPIWRAAGRLGLPVVIHTGDPKAFWLPVDEKNERREELLAHPGWSLHGEKVPSFEALLAELEHVVARNADTIFVSVHFGNDAEDPEHVAQLLDRYPNLYVDLAARVPEIGRHDPAKLRAMFEKHADHILYGSDLGVSKGDFLMLGSYGHEPNLRSEVHDYFERQVRWLETTETKIPSPTPIQGRWTIDGLGLSAATLAKIYVKNAARLFGPPPRRLDLLAWRVP